MPAAEAPAPFSGNAAHKSYPAPAKSSQAVGFPVVLSVPGNNLLQGLPAFVLNLLVFMAKLQTPSLSNWMKGVVAGRIHLLHLWMAYILS